jgi:hypothetical protein
MVICVDEKTNLQPRPRLAATLPTRPGQPLRLEHEYKRVGALHLIAVFDTRTGKVYARTEMRKRQGEFIARLSQLDREIPPSIGRISLVLDTSSVHTGKQVRAWVATHPRFVCHFLPVHCSWMIPSWSNGLAFSNGSDCASATSLPWITWPSGLWHMSPNGMLKRIRSTGLPSLRPSSWPSVKLRLLAF